MSLFIPTKLRAGYQKRRDTYSQKLAYVIYYDTQGKLRKEASWRSWRDESIPFDEYDNTPIEGFVINKNVGETRWHWDVRRAYIRIFDPRGFEVEITLANLIHILEHCNCVNKALSGSFVYAWDGTELVLLSTNSPDYQELCQKTETLLENKYLRGSDLIEGYTYATIDGEEYVYLCKAPEIKYNVNLYSYPFLNDQKEVLPIPDRQYLTKPKFWFVDLKYKSIICMSSVTRKFYSSTSTTTHPKLEEFKEKLNRREEFVGVDFNNKTFHPFTLDEFKEYVDTVNRPWIDFTFGTVDKVTGKIHEEYYAKVYEEGKVVGYRHTRTRNTHTGDTYYIGIKEVESIKEIFDRYRPFYIQTYLTNGNHFKKYLVN